MNYIIHGYCENELKKLPDNSVDMVFTSPPYADRRKNTYGGIPEDKYIEWFKPIAIEIKRVLKPTGSFFLNIKPHTNKGERSLYVFDLVLFLKRELGFWFVEEYCWTKNAFPGTLKGRFKNAFEPVYHFTIDNPNQITFNPVACGTPMKEESIARTYRKQCGAPKNGSGMTGMNTTNIRNLKLARPSNVININNVSNQFTLKSNHSATFPTGLVEFFVKSFSNEGDLIVDCFAGSGTTGVVCIDTNRNYILIDKEEANIDLILKRVGEKQNKKIMIQLNELSKIASGKAERDEQERLERERKYNEKQEKEYQEAIENLERRLKNAALDGKNKLRVAHFSAFAGGNISDRLHKKRGSYGNFCVAWNKAIFESDVIENMQGNLKRVYEYLKTNNLNPKVEYWTDGGGMDEGFELVVQW